MWNNKIALSESLQLPIDVVTETIAVLGIRGSGKTNSCVVLTEELQEAGQQVVVIDPTDSWWGIRSSKDGKHDGYPVVVFGGRHGDVPLDASNGAIIADVIVENRVSAILSLRHFESQADQRRLVTDFARRLYHRKGEAGRDTPMMLIIDEAHLFVPQRVGAAEAQMVGAIQKIVRQGRASGLGVTVIDQRAASVNKDVLTQLEVLICHRTSSPQDRKALEAWIEQHDTGDRKKEFLARLPALEQGTAWVWSPEYLDIFQETHVRERHTFDSSATPKVGERPIVPTRLAHVDMVALRHRLASTIEQAKADDPKALHARIKELETALAGKGNGKAVAQPAPPPPPPERIEVPVLSDQDLAQLGELIDQMRLAREKLDETVQRSTTYLDVIRERLLFFRNIDHSDRIKPMTDADRERYNGAVKKGNASRVAHGLQPFEEIPTRPKRTSSPPKAESDNTTGLEAGEYRVLVAVAQQPRRRASRSLISLLTEYARSTRDKYVQHLTGKGLVISQGNDIVALEAGIKLLGPNVKKLPMGAKLREHYLDSLPGGEKEVFREVVKAWPEAVDREAVSTATNYARSTRDKYIERLVRRKIVEKTGRRSVRAAADLF